MDATTETAIVERTISIDASPETVWEFFVDPEKLKRWKGVDAKLELRPGGVFWCEVIPGHVAAGEYVELDPPHRLVFTWGWEKSDSPTAIKPGSSTIVVELTPEGSGTRLHFVPRPPERGRGRVTRGRLGPLPAAARGRGGRGRPGRGPVAHAGHGIDELGGRTQWQIR
jgi:uncharacterized protein YndB with AHSA1/START domain